MPLIFVSGYNAGILYVTKFIRWIGICGLFRIRTVVVKVLNGQH